MNIDVESEFSKFILSHHLSENIFFNDVDNVKDKIKGENPEDYVACLFDWERSHEGVKFWLRQHNLWIEYLRNKGVKVPKNYG